MSFHFLNRMICVNTSTRSHTFWSVFFQKQLDTNSGPFIYFPIYLFCSWSILFSSLLFKSWKLIEHLTLNEMLDSAGHGFLHSLDSEIQHKTITVDGRANQNEILSERMLYSLWSPCMASWNRRWHSDLFISVCFLYHPPPPPEDGPCEPAHTAGPQST